MKKITITIISILILIIVVLISIPRSNNNNSIKPNNNYDSIPNKNNKGEDKNMTLYIKVNNHILQAKLVDNISTQKLIEKLEISDITISMRDYANFEKVGNLGFSLPRQDETITTKPGDLILYEGNQFVIYYDTNTWDFTRLGKIDNIDQVALKNILKGDTLEVTLSLNKGDN